ncbi:allantoinase AllB [Demequina sp. NBRC 110057]|uniref:allantoinase AllB n=1 Tax=Demequina sp. NBRC 110057 TaxID=1570346 RepID=UPI0009FFE570|nr:allantoinase AllB [Demequina sp. NBRC 110057]
MTDIDLVVRARRTLIGDEWQPAAVAVRAGVIVTVAGIDAELDAAEDVTLADDEVLLPGVVDTHVHVNEPGRTEWEGFTSATLAAAAGGTTTLLDMPLNSIPPTTTVEALLLKRTAAAPQVSMDVGFWGGAIPSSLGHLRELHDAGVFGFKCFLSPSGVDEFPHLTRDQLREAATEIAAFDGLLIVHAEDPDALLPHAGGSDYDDFVASRPDAAETDAIDAVIAAARDTGCRVHILHLSSAAALPAIRAAKADGVRLTVETCPHYLTFDAATIPDGATQYKCCPPVRDAANREALWEALIDGTIDLVASDHSPATAELKVGADGDWARAWGGISGVQVMLAAVASGAAARDVPLADAAAWVTRRPAAFAGLTDKGSIEVGNRGDLVAFAPAERWTVHAADLAHRNPVSAFDGHELTGRTRRTWLAGTQIFPARADARRTGRLIERH